VWIVVTKEVYEIGGKCEGVIVKRLLEQSLWWLGDGGGLSNGECSER